MGLFEEITGLDRKKKKEKEVYVPGKVNLPSLESIKNQNIIDTLDKKDDQASRNYSIALQQKEQERENYLNKQYIKNYNDLRKADQEFEKKYDNTKINQYAKDNSDLNPASDIVNTVLDLGINAGKGFLNTVEGTVDTGRVLLADIINVFDKENDYANYLRFAAEQDSTGSLFGTNDDLGIKGWTKGIERHSASNDLLNSVAQGVGNIAAFAGFGGLGAGLGATSKGAQLLTSAGSSFSSSWGNTYTELKRQGLDDSTARKNATINAIAETASEQFFDKIPGITSAGWGDKLTGKIGDAASNLFKDKISGKTIMTILDGLSEGSEEVISNMIQQLGNDFMYLLDETYTYDKDKSLFSNGYQLGDISRDVLSQLTSKESLESFISASISSFLVNSGKSILNNQQKNKIINAYAKDNGISFEKAKSLLSNENIEIVKNEVERDKTEYNSKVELNDIAEQRILNYMQSNTEKGLDNEIKAIEKEQKKKFTEEEKQELKESLKERTEDQINSPLRYQSFTLNDKEKTDNKKSNELAKSFVDAKVNNTEDSHKLYNLLNSLQNSNETSHYKITTNEQLVEMGILKRSVDNQEKMTYVLPDGTESVVNGFKKGNTIYINADGINAFETTIGHEIGEAIKASDKNAYNDLKSLVKEFYGEGDLESYKKAYGENLTDSIEDEYINDKLGDLFANEKLINKIADNRNLLEKFIYKVKSIVKYVTSSEEKKQMLNLQKQLEDKYVELYKEANFRKGKRGPSFSLKSNNQYGSYWNIETDKDIFKNITSSQELKKSALNYIKNGNENFQVIDTLNNNDTIRFIRKSGQEYVYGKNAQHLSNQKFNQKMRIAPSIDDLINNSTIKYKSPLQHENKMFPEGFDNFQGTLKIDNSYFKYIIRLGINKDSNSIFYDLSLDNKNMQKGTDTIVPESKRPSLIKNKSVPLSNNNMSQSTKKVKLSLSEQKNLPLKQKGLTYTEDITDNIVKRGQEYNLPIAEITSKNEILNKVNNEINDNLPFYEVDEEKTVEDKMKERRKKLADDRIKKMIDKQTFKSIKDVTKIAKDYLGFNQQETNKFKEQIKDLSKLSKEKLINSNNYEKVKDIVKQYAEKDLTFINQEIKEAQKDIRKIELIVSDDLKAQITDWSFFRKSSGLNIKKGQKSNVDTIYEEIVNSYPGMFDSSITNYADQLQELSEFLKRDNKYVEHFQLTDDTINQITNKLWNKLSKDALTKQEINELENEINQKVERRTREVVQNDLLNQMGITIEDLQEGNDITAIAYQRTDPTRLNEKVFGYETGKKINEATVGFVKHQEAERTRFVNKEKQDIANLGIKARSKESAAVQKWGEHQYVNKEGEVVEYNDHDLMTEFPKVETQEKIKNAANYLRTKYDSYIDKINATLTDMGYDAIPKRKDYFKHFFELEDKLSQWGIPYSKESLNAEDLPTDINGLTDQFKPGKNFFASAMERKGIKTSYDAITGIDKYLDGASNLMFHTESIQRYRSLSKLIRENFGRSHGLDNIDLMSDEEAEQRVKDVYDNKLTKYAAWLDEQANSIAGKKGAIDRSVERFLGRKGYTLLNGIKKQVGSNMTGFNLRSSLTNFASAIQGASKTQKLGAMQGFAFALKNFNHVDEMINKSDFLATRFGTDSLSKKKWQKISEAGQVFMNASDKFTSLQIWGGKYYEGLNNGLTEEMAIKQADDFASRIMGDRSKGQTAEIFNSKTLGLFTQFQLEVNNQWSSMIHDNKMEFNKNPGLTTALSVAGQLGQLYAASWFFNNLMKALTGSDVMFDPIDLLMGIFKPDDDKSLEERSREALGKVVDQLPMASIFTGGRIPISEAFQGIDTGVKFITGQKDKYGNSYTLDDVKDDFIGSAAYYLFPTGYGQLKKTTQGLMMYDENLPIAGSYTKSGNLRFEADTSILGKLQAAVFGRNASKNAREYYDKGYSTLSEKQVNEALNANLPINEYREINDGIKKAKQQAKQDDESQSEAMYDYIYNLPISMEQKNSLINSKLGTGDIVKDKNDFIKYIDKKNNVYWYDKENEIIYNNKYKKVDYLSIDALTQYSNKKDLTDYGDYGSLEEFNYANNNPEKYSTITQITDYKTYNEYKNEIDYIKQKYSKNDTATKNKRQNEIQKYINSLPLNQYQKLMLQKTAGGYSIKDYEKSMFKYINNLDLTKKEKQNIHKELFG